MSYTLSDPRNAGHIASNYVHSNRNWTLLRGDIDFLSVLQRRRSLASQAVVNYQSGEAPPHRTAYARFGDSDDSD